MKIFIGVLLASFLAISAFAAMGAQFKGCTLDKKVALLTLYFHDEAILANPAVAEHVSGAFVGTAASLPANRLVSQEGYTKFLSLLSPEDIQAIESIPGAPALTGESCDPPKGTN